MAVATTGNDAWPGTLSQHWATIQKAADTMVAGDTVLVRGGVYAEMVTPKNSGNANAQIVYSGYPGEVAVIDGTTGAGACIYLPPNDRLRYLVFKDLTLRNAPSANFWAEASATKPKDHLTLDGLTVESSYLGVFLRKGVKDSSIVNCELFGNQYNIYLDRSNTDILIDGNHIYDTEFIFPQDRYSNNINLYGQPGELNERITISNNDVHDGEVQGIEVFHARDVLVRSNHSHDNGATGIQIEAKATIGVSRRIVVEGNLCENNSRFFQAETGIWVDDTDEVIVQYNVIRGNEIGLLITGSNQVIARFNTIHENHRVPFINSAGIHVRASPNGRSGADDVIVHNTLHRNGLNSQRAHVVLGLWSTEPPVDRIVFKNNIISESLNSRDLWVQWLTHEIDYNDYFDPPGERPVRFQC